MIANGQQNTKKEITRQAGQTGRCIGANHLLRPVRQKDEIHNAKDKRQPGSDQKQRYPELEPVK